MAQSLLAHMYSHIRGSQEDIATYSLQYLVSKSAELNRTFTNLLGNSLGKDLGNNLRYSCQAAGEDLERPDMSGANADNEEVVLCEAKFYAALTENQPKEYQHIFRKYPASYLGWINNATVLPIFAPTDASLDEIAKDIEKQILKYVKEIDEDEIASSV